MVATSAIFFLLLIPGVPSSGWLFDPLVSWQIRATIIGLPAVSPLKEDFVTFSILQMNDIYEALPLGNGARGGLARVATIRKWLQEQTPDVLTVLVGDMLSPCALDGSVAKSERLHGRHMVSIMNTLGLDFMTFGNHEFDLPRELLLQRIAESNFEWISTNVRDATTGRSFPNVSEYKLLNVRGCRLLIIGITVDENAGPGDYADIVPNDQLINFVQSFIAPFQGQYDVLMALTHLQIATDVLLAETIPQISLILGGHEHEGWHIWRGPQNTHITKADANAASVFVHRIAFGLQSKKVTVHRTWVPVDQNIPEDATVAREVDRWYSHAFQRFERSGLHPGNVVVRLPADVELDGRDKFLRQAPTPLSVLVCRAQVERTAAFRPDLGFINSGLIRIDDHLFGTVTEYDVIRMFPFPNVIVAVKAPGHLLADLFTWGHAQQGTGMFSFPCGADQDPDGRWVLSDGTALDGSDADFVLATNSYLLDAPGSPLASPKVTRLGDVGPYTTTMIDVLRQQYKVGASTPSDRL